MNMGDLEYDEELTTLFHAIMQISCIDCKNRELYLLLTKSDVCIGMPDAPDGTKFLDNTNFFKRPPLFRDDLSPEDQKVMDRWHGWKNDCVYRIKKTG